MALSNFVYLFVEKLRLSSDKASGIRPFFNHGFLCSLPKTSLQFARK